MTPLPKNCWGTKMPHKKLMPRPMTLDTILMVLPFSGKELTSRVSAVEINVNTRLFNRHSRPFWLKTCAGL